METHPVFKKLSELDNKSLVILDSLLLFFCTDGLIRILGVKDVTEDADWWAVFEEAKHRLRELNIDRMRTLASMRQDPAAVAAFARYILDRIKTLEEIQKRLEQNPVGKKFFFHWAEGSGKKEISEFCSSVKPLKNYTGTTFQKERVDWGTKDAVNDGLEGVYSSYISHIKGLKDISVDPFPPSPLAKTLPIPGWDEATAEIMRQFIFDNLYQVLPVLDGNMEDSWKNAHNYRKAGYRKANPKVKINHQLFDTLRRSFLPSNSGFLGKKFEFTEWEHEENERRQERTLRERKEKVFRVLDELLKKNKARKPDQIRLAFELMFSGDTQEKAAKESGVTDRMLRNYLTAIENILKNPAT